MPGFVALYEILPVNGTGLFLHRQSPQRASFQDKLGKSVLERQTIAAFTPASNNGGSTGDQLPFSVLFN